MFPDCISEVTYVFTGMKGKERDRIFEWTVKNLDLR